MKNFTAKYIKYGINSFTITVNFVRHITDCCDIIISAKRVLRQQVMNPDDYKLLSITEK